MAKSVGNYIGIDDSPEDRSERRCRFPTPRCRSGGGSAWTGRCPSSTRWVKLALARRIVERYHGDEAAREAEAHFSRVVRRGEAPEDVPTALPAGDPIHLPAVMRDAWGLSTSEARRLIARGGVESTAGPWASSTSTRASSRRAPARRQAPFRAVLGRLRPCPSPGLTPLGTLLVFRSRLEEAAWKGHLDFNWSAQDQSDTTSFRSVRASGASWRLFYAFRHARGTRSLSSTACRATRPLGPRGREA